MPAPPPPSPCPAPAQDTFIFRVEGTGVLPPEEILLTACEVLQKKIRDLDAGLKEEAAIFDRAGGGGGGPGGAAPMQVMM